MEGKNLGRKDRDGKARLVRDKETHTEEVVPISLPAGLIHYYFRRAFRSNIKRHRFIPPSATENATGERRPRYVRGTHRGCWHWPDVSPELMRATARAPSTSQVLNAEPGEMVWGRATGSNPPHGMRLAEDDERETPLYCRWTIATVIQGKAQGKAQGKHLLPQGDPSACRPSPSRLQCYLKQVKPGYSRAGDRSSIPRAACNQPVDIPVSGEIKENVPVNCCRVWVRSICPSFR